MADIGTVLGAAQTLFAALECSILKEVCSALGYKSQLEDLKGTVQTVQSVLLDAAATEELTHAARDYIEKLKAAVYDADDLFDEFRTVAERKQHHKDSKLSNKVRLFFSSENSLKVAYKMSREIRKIRKNLDGIARDHANFGFAIDSKRIRNKRDETWSYVNTPTVIGRENDVDAIVEKLLDLNGEKAAPFLTVVGVGGMGKTTLAQLVCADKRVKDGFSSNVWWVCVADENNNQFDKKAILGMILDLASGYKHHELSLEEIQTKLRRELEGKKYLLVLDDLWNEDRVNWMEFKNFLMLGVSGSRIMVTTRSHDVAKAIGDSDIHVLKGLSDENSWTLFEMIAFEKKLDSLSNPLEIEIGKKIVRQCSNVPLAIKVVGSLLCGQSLDKWQTFERSGLGGIRKGGNQIMSILKFSYHNLEPSLKSCFTYCALFPKDYVIEKEMLIRHWMAHGYIVPFDRGQSIAEASEEHFLILLRRCFFQDVRMDRYGNVCSFKMHDLMHDVAEEPSGKEVLVATRETKNLGDKVRHVFEDISFRKENFYSNVKVRSYLRVEHVIYEPLVLQVPLDTIISHGGCLRTLTLVSVGITSLPDSIGGLLHLRYLDVSRNHELKTLPGSVTKLHNLQTLQLKNCWHLSELPKKFSRLVNLMHLNIEECRIRCMPMGMDKLTSLCELTNFVASDESSSGEKQVGQLKDLKGVAQKLKGHIQIDIHIELRGVVFDWEGSVFERSEKLHGVTIKGPGDEVLLEKLMPHSNVKEFELRYYKGVEVPRWGRADYNWSAILPNLVSITIGDCPRLKHLPLLSKLKHLKSLTLTDLLELEYVDETSSISNPAECTFFPSLESLKIRDVPKLEGWWRGVEFADSSNNARLWQQSFPRLSRLHIQDGGYYCVEGPMGVENELNVCLDRVVCLKSLPAGRLTEISLRESEVERLAEVGEVFKNCFSLRSLTLYECRKLSRLSGGLEHLATLESLEIVGCKELDWEEGDDDGSTPWRHLHHNLRSLILREIESMTNLPKGMQYLTSLQNLRIQYCENLKEIPEWISCLSSLESLIVYDCSMLKSIPEAMQKMRCLNRLQIDYCPDELEERCKEPDGEDWPKIRHIPIIHIRAVEWG